MKENTMPKLIISTCGTSILSNGAPETTRKLLISHANARTLNDIPETARPAIEAHVKNQLASFIAAPDLAALRKQSAELNGIISLYSGVLQGKQDEHILLTTDTWLGEQGASAIASILQSKGFTASNVKRVPGLRTDSVEDFRAAMSDVVKWAVETLPGYKAQGYEVIFNLVGGFKAVQGFMQTLGTLHADRCVYLFEGTSDLITLPRLPLKMDSESWVRENLSAFRRMNKNLPVLVKNVRNVPELFLFTIDGEATLSEWGQLVWSEAMDAMYKVEVHPSPSAKLVFGPDFLRSVSKLDIPDVVRINRKVDDLVLYLEKGNNPPSLDFKEIKGVAIKGATFEIDAWRDGAAKRLFGHFDPQNKAIFVLDRLDVALH